MSVYKGEGYGWYWILIEMMRDANAYRLQCEGKYWAHAIASEMKCEPEKAQVFINDCINEFKLFDSDGSFFWSNSLLRRMDEKDEKSTQARGAAIIRWEKERERMRLHSERIANEPKNDAIKESKVKEKKENEIKEILIFPFESSEFMQVWNTLIKTKKWRKKESSALQASLKKLSGYSESEAIQMMENSIAGEYQGLFELKDNKNGKSVNKGFSVEQAKDFMRNA